MYFKYIKFSNCYSLLGRYCHLCVFVWAGVYFL